MKLLLIMLIAATLISCSSGTNRNNSNEDYSDDEINESSCGYEDGTHSASVEYYNPETGHSATYSLDVEVENCEVVQINFPNGGWLDSDHISAGELGSDGSTTCEGEDGKTYDVQLD